MSFIIENRANDEESILMTEAEFFGLILGIKEIQVDRVDWHPG